MKTGFLPKQKDTDSNGFTVIPNHILDGILNLDGDEDVKISDSIALATFLLRHIPGQKGSVKLAFDFSQSAICASLGWGKTNHKRFKRALQSLEKIGLLSVHLYNNNLLALRVDASLKETGGQKDQTPETKSSGSIEVFDTPPLEVSATPLLSKNINKQNINKTHHQVSEVGEPNEPTQNIVDDEVNQIIDFYREEFNLSVPHQHKQTFIEEYEYQGRPKKQVLNHLTAL